MRHIDPVALAQALIRCPSVTPADAGALAVLESTLRPLGFVCERLRFAGPGSPAIENLFARAGAGAPHFCFAGHTDVVPPGDIGLWRYDPFSDEIVDSILYGRGAADMKSAVAAFVAAAAMHLEKGPIKGSISLLITGDEEGDAVNGTKAVLEHLKSNGVTIDHCLVGEPASAAVAGDTVKIGRRGSMRIQLTVRGVQGHTAYPQNAVNPIPILAAIVTRLANDKLDRGTPHFEPTTLVFTTFDVGNPASNVSPAEARAVCNIRFNDLHTPQGIFERIEKTAMEIACESHAEIFMDSTVGAAVFLTEPGRYTELLARAISDVTGARPAYSTGGGTSDARFIRHFCPVAEVGLPGTTMHKADECVPLREIHRLTDIYAAILDAYFADPPV